MDGKLNGNGGGYNPELDFWKFVAAVVVMLFHSFSFFGGSRLVMPRGLMAVDWFFMVTGFLFASSVFRDVRPFDRNNIGQETCSFLGRKVRTFIVYYIFGFLVSYAAKILQTDGVVLRPARILLAIPDFLLLKETGVPYYDVFGVGWYLSSMLIALFILYPIFRWNKKLFAFWGAPILALGCLGYLFVNFGQTHCGVACPLGINMANNFRAIGEISLGVVAYEVAIYVKNVEMSTRVERMLPVFGIGAMLIAIGLMAVTKNGAFEPTMLIAFFVALGCMGSGRSSIQSFYSPRLCRILGKMSLTLYLTHPSIRWGMIGVAKRSVWLHDLMVGRDVVSILKVLAIYVSLSLLLAWICMLVCDPIHRRLFGSLKRCG